MVQENLQLELQIANIKADNWFKKNPDEPTDQAYRRLKALETWKNFKRHKS